MFPRVRSGFGLLFALTFGATSAAPNLFHACAAGREMVTQVLHRTVPAQPASDCDHNSGSSHSHSSHGGCNCLGHACSSIAMAQIPGQVALAIAVAQEFAPPIFSSPDAPRVDLRHYTPATRAPPTILA